MNKKEMYALRYPARDLSMDTILDFFETKEAMEAKMLELSKKMTLTNQSFLEFTRVFPKGALLDGSSYDNFVRSYEENKLPKIETVGSFVVQKTLKKGKKKLKEYNFREDFDWQLGEWAEKGIKDVVILNENNSYNAEYYFDRDVKKQWGDKEPLFA